MARGLIVAMIAFLVAAASGCGETKPTPVRMAPEVLKKRTPKPPFETSDVNTTTSKSNH